jgi:putative Mg2+ transporter-C (MgtC) family protein
MIFFVGGVGIGIGAGFYGIVIFSVIVTFILARISAFYEERHQAKLNTEENAAAKHDQAG